jgi:hypothetical protein
VNGKPGIYEIRHRWRETAIAKMRVFRVPEFLSVPLMLGLLAALLRLLRR